MDNETSWWYLFNPETYAYAGMVLTDMQPDNSTSIAPGDVVNPVWDPTLKVWNGEDVNDKLSGLNNGESNVPVNVQLANLTSELEDIKKDVEQLKNK